MSYSGNIVIYLLFQVWCLLLNARESIRFADECGADMPLWIGKRLIAYQDDSAGLARFCLEVMTQLCRQLLDNKVPGLHFYSMSRAQPTLAVAKNLGLLS